MGLEHEKLYVHRLSIVLSRLGGRGYSMEESSATCRTEAVAVDPDSDFDPEDEKI
jgi:hypothetical protein